MRFSTQNPEGFLELDLFEDVFVVVADTEDGETKLLLLLKEKSKKNNDNNQGDDTRSSTYILAAFQILIL